MTVIGLCLGGGQLILDITATVLAVITLRALKWVDLVMPREHHAMLVVTCHVTSNVVDELAALDRSLAIVRGFKCKGGPPR